MITATATLRSNISVTAQLVSKQVGSCDDATVQINGVEVATPASGATVDIPVNLDGVPSGSWDGDSWEVTSNPCADATVQLNGIDMADIASGDTENILVLQSNDMTQVGSKQGTHWRIDDSAISINGSLVADVRAEDSLDIDVTQDGSPVGSWDGSAWIVPSCPAGGGSIEVTVSDSSPSIGETITITGTASSYTPDSYLFFAYNDTTNEITFIAEQASNSFDWTVPSIKVDNYTIYVLGVENGTPDVTAFGTVDISVSSNFLLDTTEGAGANFAFAFFRFRAAYNGPAAFIRRSSDQAQKAFYFDTNNVLSLSSEDGAGVTLGDWIGANDGYLVTGYSQDTSGVTFTAINAADQQRIIIGGVLVDINDAVAMVGNNDDYVISQDLTVKSAFIVAENDAYNIVNYVMGGVNQGLLWGGSFAGVTGIGMFEGTFVQSNIEDLNPHLASLFTDTGVYVDGNLEASGTISALTLNRVGGRPDASNIGMNGKIACIVTYPTDKTADRATIEANINSNFTPSLLP